MLLKNFEHLIFQVSRPISVKRASKIILQHPHVQTFTFNKPYNIHLSTGRASWKLHVLPEYWIPPEIAQYQENMLCPEDPRFHVIVSPEKIHQVPAWIRPSIVLPRTDVFQMILYGGLTQEKFGP